ncbi:MAG: winged helix-turn-helix transcriptional regulator [Candidatus Melainabacteria bacterium]
MTPKQGSGTMDTTLPGAGPHDLQEVTRNLNRLIKQAPEKATPSLARALELIGDKYSLQIIHVLYQMNCQRFVELEHQVEGISPRTLSARLKHLEQHGLITRQQFPTIPPRVDYDLTDKGRDLASTLIAMERWADKWVD